MKPEVLLPMEFFFPSELTTLEVFRYCKEHFTTWFFHVFPVNVLKFFSLIEVNVPSFCCMYLEWILPSCLPM